MGGGYSTVALAILYALSVLWEVCMPRVTEMFRLPSELVHQFSAFLSYFASGMLFVFYWESLVPRLKYVAPACAVVLAAVSVADIPIVMEIVRPFCLAAVVMFLALKIRLLFGIVKKDFSYGMYLVHYPFICILNLTNVFVGHPIAGLLFVIGTSFACSYMLEKIVSINISKAAAKQSGKPSYNGGI